jgi:hypothetical protein
MVKLVGAGELLGPTGGLFDVWAKVTVPAMRNRREAER